MALNRFTVKTDQLEQRIRRRLGGTAGATQPTVAWADTRETLVVNASSLKVRVTDGWLLCNLDVHPLEAPVATLQFLYFLGRESDGEALSAAGTIHSRATDASVAGAWGDVLRRVIWDGVLDVMEGVVNYAGRQAPGRALTLLGFHCTEGQLHVEVQTADAA